MHIVRIGDDLSVKYGKPDVSVSYPKGVEPTDLWLTNGIHTFLVGPDQFVWFIPNCTNPAEDAEVSGLWVNATNCREEDEWHNGPVVPRSVELAHWTVSLALSAMYDSRQRGDSPEMIRESGSWVFDLIAWEKVYSHDESGEPDMSGNVPAWVEGN